MRTAVTRPLVLALACAATLATGCSGSSASSVISAAKGGEVILPDGLGRLLVPPGALAADTEITVETGENEVPGGVGPALIFGPSGTTFDPPAVLELDVDEGGWDASLDAFGLAPAVAVEDDGVIETALTVGNGLGGAGVQLVRHFSNYVVVPAPDVGWQPQLGFLDDCTRLWQAPVTGGELPDVTDAPIVGSCPQARGWVGAPDAEGATPWPPAGEYDFAGVMEWPDVAGDTLSVTPATPTTGEFYPRGSVQVHWDVHVEFEARDTAPAWCDGEAVASAIAASVARAGGETARVLYRLDEDTVRCEAPPVYDGTATTFRLCTCVASFESFPWPPEDIPYTVNGTQLTFYEGLFDYSVPEGEPTWWFDIPVVASVDVLEPLPDTSEYAFASMKLVVEK